jgi:putative transposase
MPRANRHFLPGHVWHITHRCHKKEFLLKFAKDRENWIHWLFEARKRYGLCVLNYMVTSNHVHLLVKDTGNDVISKSMQLIAGRTAQTYNQRKHRKGAFWEDRYHATAVQTDEHFIRCLVYIDLNMVRAGVVRHPEKWPHCGYHEIQQPPVRYRIIDQAALLGLTHVYAHAALQRLHREWVDNALQNDRARHRDDRWTQGLAVGQREYVKQVQDALGYRARGRECLELEEGYYLKEAPALYGPFGSKKAGFKL